MTEYRYALIRSNDNYGADYISCYEDYKDAIKAMEVLFGVDSPDEDFLYRDEDTIVTEHKVYRVVKIDINGAAFIG